MEMYSSKYEVQHSPVISSTSVDTYTTMLLTMLHDFIRTNPLRHWNFFWVYVSRFLYNFGFFSVHGYMLYFFTDAFGSNFSILVWSRFISSPIKANSLHSLFKYMSSLVSSVLGGALSDRTGRKPFVLLSATFIALGALGTAVVRDYSVVLALALVMGLGFGSHHAVDMGLVTDVLPNESNTARDMSIWQTSLTIPHLLAPFISGLVIRYCDQLFSRSLLPPHFGYVVIFVLCALCQVLSALAILCVRAKHTVVKKERCPDCTRTNNSSSIIYKQAGASNP